MLVRTYMVGRQVGEYTDIEPYTVGSVEHESLRCGLYYRYVAAGVSHGAVVFLYNITLRS